MRRDDQEQDRQRREECQRTAHRLFLSGSGFLERLAFRELQKPEGAI
jgi:hypothetical protein